MNKNIKNLLILIIGLLAIASYDATAMIIPRASLILRAVPRTVHFNRINFKSIQPRLQLSTQTKINTPSNYSQKSNLITTKPKKQNNYKPHFSIANILKSRFGKFFTLSAIISSIVLTNNVALAQDDQNQAASWREQENKIEFDRENFSIEKASWYNNYTQEFCEGFWASHVDPVQDLYQGVFPFPKAYKEPWIGKEEFLKKLYQIESLADKPNSVIIAEHFKGMAPSRLKPDCFVGNKTYIDLQRKIKWPQGYSGHYIQEFNVKPSREFYRYVMEFPLPDMQ